MTNLVELDSLEILVIVDNELDPISASPNPAVQQSGGLKEIGVNGPIRGSDGVKELRMDNICCSAHGLSLMITGIKGTQRHTILFDTGPEEDVWERNALRLRAEVGEIEAIQLSHWHRDHSGGMLKALAMITGEQKKVISGNPRVHVDLHPARPKYSGFHPPGMSVISMESDPSFDDIERVGGVLVKSDQPHTLLDDMFLVSGEIPRVTAYETGLKFGVRFWEETGEWLEDTKMADERFLMCRLKGLLQLAR